MKTKKKKKKGNIPQKPPVKKDILLNYININKYYLLLLVVLSLIYFIGFFTSNQSIQTTDTGVLGTGAEMYTKRFNNPIK